MNKAKITPINQPVTAIVNVPGSKSYSLRALVISALCDDKFQISNLLSSTDISAMKSCLEEIKINKSQLYVNESGVTARFITALACITPSEQIISGAPSLQKRPINDLVDGLRQLGAEIEYLEKDGFLPLKVRSQKLSGNEITLKGDVSSQYLSALLLIAPALENGLSINISGQQISKPYIDMTIDIMSYFGVAVDNQDYQKYVIKPQKYVAKDYAVEADFSSASYFYAINALSKSKITVLDLSANSKQGDKKFVDMIQSWNGEIKPIDINVQDFPDQAMTLAVLLAFAKGKSTISGVRSLRVKETERVMALENELAKMNILTESTEDSLTIYGGNPSAANIDTYSDHRIAMSFAVAATKLTSLSIFDPSVVNKTFPGFWDELKKITNVEIKNTDYSNIVLTGMRGTGKSTVGKIVAKKLGMDYVDVDEFIENKHKINIKQAVRKNGWEYFRKLESEAIIDITKKTNIIISTGAGAVMFDKNAENLTKHGLIIMLKADPATLAKRISSYDKLPALTDKSSVLDEMKQVWQQRKSRYYSLADFIIDTENLSLDAVAAEIIGRIKS